MSSLPGCGSKTRKGILRLSAVCVATTARRPDDQPLCASPRRTGSHEYFKLQTTSRWRTRRRSNTVQAEGTGAHALSPTAARSAVPVVKLCPRSLPHHPVNTAGTRRATAARGGPVVARFARALVTREQGDRETEGGGSGSDGARGVCWR